ncbi:DUF1905 domain-containing protein [Salinibacterium sp. G-O1]|uniref:DUF1905 domain-containing protein n=1 Tax=Salinibacterium sp. G-O1 TaxID=3046208 RepID=UPI0024B96045|nr:DUF1905 domain-containing protein [Salinibacterium sp. G-O1]MDJ0335620.1 DUF1905 domain-containing protein [Salinibacterium sp. G-O1]
MTVTFSSEVWRWQARRDDWFFVTLPAEFAEPIREVPRKSRGFRSVPVRATIGATTWTTSIFPAEKLEGYSLPVKKSVRAAEGIELGDVVEVTVELI